MTESRQSIDNAEQANEDQPVVSPGIEVPGEGASPPVGTEAAHAHANDGLAEIEGDLDELVKTAAQRDEYLSLAQRTQADFENYRKRIARESAGAQARGVIGLAK